MKKLLVVAIALIAIGCQKASESQSTDVAPPLAEYALAIHGGAGTVDKDGDPERHQQYIDAMQDVLRLGADRLEAGESSLDVVEELVSLMEDNPLFNAGRGAVFTNQGKNELDAAIMDGTTLKCGTVTGVTTVKNPIRLARRVMEQTRHIMFAGPGAESFADSQSDIERVDPSYFATERRYDAWQKALAREQKQPAASPPPGGSTVGAVALDKQGRLAAATSTGGLTNKRFGRVGDVPIIGAGTYANENVAVSCTGIGEQFIRHTIARDVGALMEYKGLTLAQAADELINERLEPGDGGLIAVDRRGGHVTLFSTQAMPRGSADSTGHFEVAIW